MGQLGQFIFLHQLFLQNFRSSTQKSFRFSNLTTLLVGPNASGKTSVIEGIFLLGTGKGFRSGKDEEMVAYEAEVAKIKGVLACDGSLRGPRAQDTLEVLLTRGMVQHKRVARKKFVMDGAGKQARDFVGHLPVVLFEPQDLMLILGSPSCRRVYLDTVLSQADWQYQEALHAYAKGMRQRNRLLGFIADGKAQAHQLYYWDQLLNKHGQYLQDQRQNYLETLNGWLSLRDQPIRFAVTYQPNVMSLERLATHYQAQVATRTTLIGPHRDDFVVRFQVPGTKYHEEQHKGFDTRDVEHFGSRGQQRMAVLNLKLAELVYLEQKLHTKPVLLLDDIFSELDQANEALVMTTVGNQQTIITTTTVRGLKGLKQAEVIDLH